MTEPTAGIVLTDARGNVLPSAPPKAVLGPKSPCPKCGAQASRRMDSAGFGGRRVIVCECCGFDFPPEAL